MSPPKQHPYTIRPGIYADIPAYARLYMSAFTDPRSQDNLVDALFPGWRDKRPAMDRMLRWMFEYRYWSLEYRMMCVVDESRNNEVVGFACWKRPEGDISWVERWLYPSTWFRYLAMSIQALRYKYSPGPKIDTTTVEAFMKIMSRIGPTLLNSPRRRAAQYLSMIAVDPTLQGSGLGLALMEHGLAQCEAMEEDVAVVQEQTTPTRRGRASWLIARLGTEAFYERFGFGVVGRMNVDELSHWNGGAIMFRE